jgi:hypothetical protein
MIKWFFKTPTEKLEARYHALLKEARSLQRAGKIPEFARKTAEAEAVRQELDEQQQDAGPS